MSYSRSEQTHIGIEAWGRILRDETFSAAGIAERLRERGKEISVNAAVDELRDALAAAEKLVGGRGERLPTWGHRR